MGRLEGGAPQLGVTAAGSGLPLTPVCGHYGVSVVNTSVRVVTNPLSCLPPAAATG